MRRASSSAPTFELALSLFHILQAAAVFGFQAFHRTSGGSCSIQFLVIVLVRVVKVRDEGFEAAYIASRNTPGFVDDL